MENSFEQMNRLQALLGEQVEIRWRDPGHDWHWFTLLSVNAGWIKIRGENSPDGVHHIGDELWVPCDDVQEIKPVPPNTRSSLERASAASAAIRPVTTQGEMKVKNMYVVEHGRWSDKYGRYVYPAFTDRDTHDDIVAGIENRWKAVKYKKVENESADTENFNMTDAEQRIEDAANAMLKAAGNPSLNMYMPATQDEIRKAVRKIMSDSYIQGSNDCHEAMNGSES